MGFVTKLREKLTRKTGAPTLSGRLERMKPEQREAVLARFGCFGDPAELVRHYDQMPVLGEERGKFWEIRLDETYLAARHKNDVRLIALSDVRHCYVSCFPAVRGFAAEAVVGVGDDKWRMEITTSAEAGLALYRRLWPLCSGFPARKQETEHCHSIAVHTYRISREHILAERLKGAKREVVTEQKIPTQDVIWVEQFHSDGDAETTGSDWLTLYLADGGKCRIDTASPKHGYDVARVIRSHVPHLLYGPDETYRSLFREDPQKLLELARKKSGENV